MGRRSSDGLPVVITVNVEPDQRVTTADGTAPWSGAEPTMATIERWRAEQTAARVLWVWRCDPQITAAMGDAAWGLRRWSAQIAGALERGDEVGVHPHFWRWSETFGTFVSDADDDDWKAECIRTSIDTFQEVVSAPVRVTQMGDGYMDEAIAGTLVSCGVEVDLTLEPGGRARTQMLPTEFATGTMPDRRRTPHRPFRPSQRHPCRPGRLRPAPLWALPLTTTTTEVIVDRVTVDRVGTPANLGLDPYRFRHIVTSGLAASVAAGAPYVGVLVRTDVGSNPGLLQHTNDNLGWLSDGIDGLAQRWGGVRFVTPIEALELLGCRR